MSDSLPILIYARIPISPQLLKIVAYLMLQSKRESGPFCKLNPLHLINGPHDSYIERLLNK